MPQKSASIASRLNLFLLLCAMWIARHPYFGIVQDARLYMVQTLARLDGARFAHDLYFAYGSQDSFSIFSTLFAPLVASLGPAMAHAVALVLGEALWFGALLFFVRTLFSDHRTAMWAAALAILLQGTYSLDGLFVYAEPFVTPRLFAEALVLLALAFTLRERWLVAGAILCGAAALHPLMAAPGLGILGFVLARRDRRLWGVVALGALAIFGLAFMHFAPFDRIFLQMDGDWLRAVEKRDAFAFLSRWDPASLLILFARAALFPVLWQYASERERSFLIPVAAIMVLGLLASFIGSDLFHDVLIINLQLWRASWVAALVSNAMLAAAVLRMARERLSRDLFIFAIAMEIVCATTMELAPIANIVLLLALAVHYVEKSGLQAQVRPRFVWIMAGALAIPYLIFSRFGALDTYSAHHLLLLFCSRAVALCAAWLLWTSADLSFRRARLVAPALLCAFALVTIDHRSAWDAFIEQQGVPPDLSAFTADAGNMFWERGVKLLWVKLRRPSYLSALQGTGIMFSRQTSEEYGRRGRGLYVLGTRDFGPKCAACGSAAQGADYGPKNVSEIVQACRTLPALDTIVLSELAPGSHPRVWHSPVPTDLRDGSETSADTFYRYDCSFYR